MNIYRQSQTYQILFERLDLYEVIISNSYFFRFWNDFSGIQSLVFMKCFVIHCHVVLIPSSIVLYVLRLTASDNAFGIFNFFLSLYFNCYVKFTFFATAGYFPDDFEVSMFKIWKPEGIDYRVTSTIGKSGAICLKLKLILYSVFRKFEIIANSLLFTWLMEFCDKMYNVISGHSSWNLIKLRYFFLR